MERSPMTRQGYEQLQAKLKHLTEEELPRIQKAIGTALELGDVSENAELDAAREESWRTERMIAELERQFSIAEIVDESKRPKDALAIGARVKLYDIKFKEEFECFLLGEGETRDGLDTVSVNSPMGRALLGHKPGEEVEFQGPRGPLQYRVLSFRYE